MRLLVAAVVIFLVLGTSSSSPAGEEDEKVLERYVDTLTFEDGKFTTFRRTQPYPQIACSGNYCDEVQLQKHIVCDQLQPGQWRCEGSPYEKHKFHRTDVICEGYDSKDDPYILVGSCMVDYTLQLKSDDVVEGGKLTFNQQVLVLIMILITAGGVYIVMFSKDFPNLADAYLESTPDQESAPSSSGSDRGASDMLMGVAVGAMMARGANSEPVPQKTKSSSSSSYSYPSSISSYGGGGGGWGGGGGGGNVGFGSSGRH